MAFEADNNPTLTAEEWNQLPITLNVPDVARVLRCSSRYVSNNAAELGGVKRANKWIFSKARIAELAGIA